MNFLRRLSHILPINLTQKLFWNDWSKFISAEKCKKDWILVDWTQYIWVLVISHLRKTKNSIQQLFYLIFFGAGSLNQHVIMHQLFWWLIKVYDFRFIFLTCVFTVMHAGIPSEIPAKNHTNCFLDFSCYPTMYYTRNFLAFPLRITLMISLWLFLEIQYFSKDLCRRTPE